MQFPGDAEDTQELFCEEMDSAVEMDSASDVEEAVIGHGKVEGPFTEIDGLEIERDDRYPVRVTVQFYKATSNGVVDAGDLDAIAASIGGVYEHADFVGSLVLPALSLIVTGPAPRLMPSPVMVVTSGCVAGSIPDSASSPTQTSNRSPRM